MTDNDYPLGTIYFYLTPECNLACRHCWIQPRYQNRGVATEYLPFDLFTDIIEQAKPLGLTAIKLTGGEPLLHPEIADILEYIRDSDYRLIVETNGTLVTEELASRIAACKNAFASVSLDGTDPDTHEWVRGVPGCFDASCKGLRLLAGAGLKPQVIMSVMRHNVNQVEEITKLAGSLGAGSVKYNYVQPTARGQSMHEAGQTLTIKELIELNHHMTTILPDKTDLRLHFPLPPAFNSLSMIFGKGNCSGSGRCNIRGIIGVLGDGSYALCGIGETVPEMVFGNAREDRLEDVWRSDPVLNEIREGFPDNLKGICSRCVMKYMCGGSCLAQNYCSSGDLWAPFWFCDMAEKEELFPESRIVPEAQADW